MLNGGYLEAGDRGRFAVQAGNVVFHGCYEAHQNVLSANGALILNLPLDCGAGSIGAVADPDLVARLAESDMQEACDALRASLIKSDAKCSDWPDELSRCLIDNPSLNLSEWAECRGLAPQSVGRGFRKAFGVTPKRFRADQRALRAQRKLPGWSGTGAALAAELGFADQAHMTRSVRELTGKSPTEIKVQ